MSSGRSRRKLSEDEAILWHRVGRTVTPLRDRPLAFPTSSPEAAEREFLEAMEENRPVHRSHTAPADSSSPVRHTPPPAPKPKPDPVIDRPTTRKIAKGRIAIDARIDLHAMTQDQAHDRLYAFLADARSRGLRHVLVVTGKGRSLGSEGVLKRMVPVWLAGSRFSGLVSGYASASRTHGGEGALYIRLRRLARADGEHPVMTPFGERLRQLRAERAMTQKQMAQQIGVSAAYLSALEHGHRGVPSWPLLQRIIACLNIIWDDADELQRLALQSAPKVAIDTSGMHPRATEFANLLQQSIGNLSPDDLEQLIHRLQVMRNRAS